MKWTVISIFLLSVIYVHFRGKVRMPFFRQLFDHSSIMAPLNILIYMFSKVPTNSAYLPNSTFNDLKILEDNWETIRNEAQALTGMEKIRAAGKNDDAGFNSFFKVGWKRFYLKWYNANHPSAEQFCPKTVALLRRTPSVKAAMFAELPPGGKLNLHRDPFAGSMRYHLGLMTPNDDRCFIEVNGERYSWRDGQGMVFDETYMHWAQNGSDVNRIIILCDIERPMRYRWAQAVNRWLGRHMMSAAASPNDTGDQTGGINKLFHFVWSAGQYRRALKKFSKSLYYVIKFGLIVSVVMALIWL
ncbi:MAG: lipid A hydroxylase LpxO [Glaciimonas sp.]|nr:lipid A hydroxylase LpxO [Glaciimonas sp.]